jgi:hypothetical protein
MAMKQVVNRMAADGVLLVHFGFVLFAVFGGFLTLASHAWIWVHAPAVLWSSLVNLAGWTCPLTPLENSYRMRVREAYEGGFVQHYVGSLVYPKGMPRPMELIAGGSILAWNALVYAGVLAIR